MNAQHKNNTKGISIQESILYLERRAQQVHALEIHTVPNGLYFFKKTHCACRGCFSFHSLPVTDKTANPIPKQAYLLL